MNAGRIKCRHLLAPMSVRLPGLNWTSFNRIFQRSYSGFPVQASNSLKKVPEVLKISPQADQNSADKSITPPEITPPPKRSVKQVFISYWKSLITDYSAVFREGYQDAKDHPRRSAILIFLVGTLGYFMWTNPSDQDFLDEYIENRSKLAVVGPAIRNSNSEEHILYLGKLMAKGQLRYQSLGFFSIIWRHDEDKCVGIYNATCEYVTPIPTEAITRLIDFGFAHRWLILEKKMADYDINEAEWQVQVELLQPGTHSTLPEQQQV